MLQEWEVLVLAKLNWNIPSVVAIDFVEHIVQVISLDLLQTRTLLYETEHVCNISRTWRSCDLTGTPR